jgi:2,5-diketo-D-gluconate reductase A
MVNNQYARNSVSISRRTMLKGSALGAAALLFGHARWAFADNLSIPAVRLNNGVMMPALGFGTYSLRGDVCTESVTDAIDAGYRLIDTAKSMKTRKLLVSAFARVESIANRSS